MSRGAARLLGSSWSRWTRTIAIAAPALAALTLTLLLLGSEQRIDAELQLVAEDTVAPGQVLALRALLFAGLHRIEGPALATAPCTVELHSGGSVLARTSLREGLGPTLEGALRVPSTLRGTAVLRAVAQHGDALLVVERPVRVREAPPSNAPVTPRALQPLQQLALGAVQGSGEPPPAALRLRVRGGACVPEEPCELLVHVGAEAASVHLAASASVTPDRASGQPSAPTAGIAVLHVTTHGPEALSELVATRAGRTVARRALRLPLALGSTAVLGDAALVALGARPALGLKAAARCIVDAFVRGQLRGTATLAPCTDHGALPFALAEAGLVRLQLRRDPFDIEGPAARTVFVRTPGQDTASALAVLAQSALRLDPSDAFAREVEAAPALAALDANGSASYLLALHDEGVAPLPVASSSLPRARLRLATVQADARKLALFVIALCAFALCALLAERGLQSATQARRVLEDAGSNLATLERERARGVLRVLATALSVLLLFAAIAAYVIVRGHGLSP